MPETLNHVCVLPVHEPTSPTLTGFSVYCDGEHANEQRHSPNVDSSYFWGANNEGTLILNVHVLYCLQFYNISNKMGANVSILSKQAGSKLMAGSTG